MTRLIEEEEAFKVLSAYYKHRTAVQDWALHDALSRVPTADTDLSEYSDRLYKLAYERGKAEAVKRGKWVFNPSDAFEAMFAKPKCSECGFESADGGNYCPNCGARMDEE